MKNFLASVLAVLLVLGLSACSGSAPSTDPTSPPESSEAPTNPETLAPTDLEPQISVYPHNAEKHFNIESITPPPSDIFTKSADENGLAGTMYVIEGTVTDIENFSETEMTAIFLETDNGEVIITDPCIYLCNNSQQDSFYFDPDFIRQSYPTPAINESIRIYAEYEDISSPDGSIYFSYGGTDYMKAILKASMRSYNGQTGSNTPATEPQNEAELGTKENPYTAGMYKVGTDLPAGEYLFIAVGGTDGYFCASEDSNQNEIIDNEIFAHSFFATVEDGQYIQAKRCMFVGVSDYTVTADPANLAEGMYRVGIDIPAGEYKLTATAGDSGYYCIYNSSELPFDIEDNDIFETSTYMTVRSGQYVLIKRCTGTIIE